MKPFVVTARHMRRTLPETEAALQPLRQRAELIPTDALKAQALSSLTHKQFHCEGGTVFATALLGRTELDKYESVVRFIVAFQTISDYLDNLCDRAGSLSAENFRRLHASMFHALGVGDPCPTGASYYVFHDHKDDGGYLRYLIDLCRQSASRLPRFDTVRGDFKVLLERYVDLQVYKHIEPDERVPALTEWHREYGGTYPELHWWEYAAATGSTLGMFALVAEAAHSETVEAPSALVEAYFPWISALHILLDYAIDEKEDAVHGDLNFVTYYESEKQRDTNVAVIIERALAAAKGLSRPGFHTAVVWGLLGLYLSDPKATDDLQRWVRHGGMGARVVHRVARGWRRRQQA